MPSGGPIYGAQASLAELKAITAEHVNNFDSQGRVAVKGANKKINKQLEKVRWHLSPL
jgi:hypothetical protein